MLRCCPFVWSQAISKGQQHGSWFLQLPRYPCNLRQWLQQLAEEGAAAAAERSRRVVAVLRPLLQGLAYLHQVRAAAWLAWRVLPAAATFACCLCARPLAHPLARLCAGRWAEGGAAPGPEAGQRADDGGQRAGDRRLRGGEAAGG